MLSNAVWKTKPDMAIEIHRQRRGRTLKFMLLLFLFIIASIPAPQVFGNQLFIGSKAPNLTGNDAISGNRINLFMLMTSLQFKRDSRGFLVVGKDGKYVNEFVRNLLILNFFSRSCIPCIREIPTFNQIAEKHAGLKVKFLYVNVDPNMTREQAQRFIDKHQIKVPMMLCNQAEAIRKYDAEALPRIYVIDQQKKIFHIVKGFDEDLDYDLNQMIDTLLTN
jgi:thiol-disulfide isomerase/thioredoxin